MRVWPAVAWKRPAPWPDPLVGREQEVALLRERWAQVKDGLGQVVLLSGEAGIGKSRLVQMLTEHVATEPQAWLTPCQCSPYYQNTALYPHDRPAGAGGAALRAGGVPPAEAPQTGGVLGAVWPAAGGGRAPLCRPPLAPTARRLCPPDLSPEQQKQQTLHALLTILLRIAAQQPVLFVMEDLHWVDPTTLELLSLLVDQGPTARILALFTFRPDFSPPWTGRSHLTQVTLPRLPRRQAAEMTGRVAHGKALPPEVVEQVVAKTDGVPLFVEELTKMVLESGLLQERAERYELTGPLPPLAIPTTLHDSLMARLDRLAAVKGLAQLGATLGREFSYELLQAVSPWDEGTLQQGLHQLVEAEFLYQRGLPPQATYLFKHALIQDAAYQSLLRSTRQRHHQRIAQVLEAAVSRPQRDPTRTPGPSLHRGGPHAQAIPYWQQAGQRASERSAYVEAIAHLIRGWRYSGSLPDTPERTSTSCVLQLTLGPALVATKGHAAPEVEQAYARARELCQQVGETPQLFPVLWGCGGLCCIRGEFQKAHELGSSFSAWRSARTTRRCSWKPRRARDDLAFWASLLLPAASGAGITLYDPQQHRAHAVLYGRDPGVDCHPMRHDPVTPWLSGPSAAQSTRL